MNALMANNTQDKVQQLQRKLYQSAKQNSKRKFHALYDKVHREDILRAAWERVRRNKGCGGIDGLQIADVEASGVEALLGELQRELKAGTYRPRPVKRTYIPKPDGSQRPLGIPVIKDRIVQMAAKLVLEHIFEADFKDFSYGFRPNRSAKQALEVVRKACNRKGWWAVDVDIKGYFDAINHEKLMLMVKTRVSDRRMQKLIRQWLEAGVMTENGYEASETGSPQGGVISPLLSNIYLHYLDTVWSKRGAHLGTMARYADDLVVICRTKKDAEHALKLIRVIMERLELILHPEKTKLVSLWAGKAGFDFLGMHHRSIKTQTSQAWEYYTLHQFPSKKAMQKMRDRIREILGKRNVLWKEASSLVAELNPVLRGWRNYYGLKTAFLWLAKVDRYVRQMFTRWYNKKRKRKRHLAEMGKVCGLLTDLKLIKLAA